MERLHERFDEVMPAVPAEYISQADAAARVGVSVDTVKRWVRRRDIKHYRFGKKQNSKILIKVTDLTAFMERHAVHPIK